MPRIRIKQVDVFTNRPFSGCFAGVVTDSDDLTTDQMQAIASEMNVDATVFVGKPTHPDADYRARIFTPRSELPFAGHPTIAAASQFTGVLPSSDASPGRLVQECGAGLIPIEILPTGSGPIYLVTQTRPEFGRTIEPALAARMLGCTVSELAGTPAECVTSGLPWLIIAVRSLSSMRRLRPDLALIEAECRTLGMLGVTSFCLAAENPDPRYEVHARTFIPGEGIAEDVVCGSGNGCIAAYLARHGIKDPAGFSYMAEQGLELGRPGDLLVRLDRSEEGQWQVQVGGQAVEVLTGEMSF